MVSLVRDRNDAFWLGVTALAIGVVAVVSIIVPSLMPWTFVALAAGSAAVYWMVRGEVTIFAWLWVLSYGLLDRPVWWMKLPGFFNLTIPRLIFVLAVAAFGVHIIAGRARLRFNAPVIWAMIALLACCFISASVFGWQVRDWRFAGVPYFRFLGGMVFPFTMFVLLYSTVNREKQIYWALIPLCIYGWYALYIGYLQYAAIMGASGARQFIWPNYINQPNWGGMTFGLHFDRARGAYTMSYPQAALLTVLFYTDLFMIRKTRGLVRLSFIIQALLVPPAVFFTGLRAAYLGFLVCAGIWCLWAGRPAAGRVKLALLGLAVLLGVVVLWDRLAQTRRATGGLAQMREINMRLALVDQSLEMAREHPFVGVGFGHFAEAQQAMQREPGSAAATTIGAMSQHNMLLSAMVETGVAGLSLTAAVFWLLYRQSLKLYRRIPADRHGLLCREFVVLFWVALASFLISAMFFDPLWDIASLGLFWSLAGLMAGYERITRDGTLAVTSPAGLD